MTKQKIAFFLNNSDIACIDCRSIENGNPGIGGSEYEILLVSYLLEKRDNDIFSYLFVNKQGLLPHNNIIYAGSFHEFCNLCTQNKINEIIVDAKNLDLSVLDKFGNELSVIVWCHNNVQFSVLDKLAQRDYIKRIVNVGREQMELYRDHMATLKSTYVYNIFPVKDKEYYMAKKISDGNHNVVYMGSLVYGKGFHALARVWKDVLRKVPDAQLFVIGSGKLYDKNAKLGKLNLASEEYEKQFVPYITDEDGRILQSVHFLGIMGDEKYDILGQCKVGVPNPTGESETFCICGIEMQLLGCNITTIKHPAYLDTIVNKDWLYDRLSLLTDYLIRRLTAPDDDYDRVYNFVSSNFGIEGNIQRWENIISNINNNKVEPVSKYNYQYKKLKDLLFKIKMACPVFRLIPPIQMIFNLKIRVVRKIKTNNHIKRCLQYL